MSVSQERIPKGPTAGPWNWRRFGQGIALTTTHSGSLIVLDCVRRGMQGAQFRVRCEPCVMVPMDDALTHPDLLLIESAPDLLDACRQLVAATDAADHVELANAVIAARAAIAKANGQQQEGDAMKDKNGVEVTIGAKAILTDAAGEGFAGRQGTVVRVEQCCRWPGEVAIVEDRRDGHLMLSMSCASYQLVIVEDKR